MPFVNAKCPNCGGKLQVDKTKKAAVCPFCEGAYIVEEAINNYITNYNIDSLHADVVNLNSQLEFEIVAGELKKYRGSATDVVIPSNVTIIGFEAFAYCQGLNSVVIPNSVTKICRHAFDGCSGLTSIVIPNSVTEIQDRAFSNCSGLINLVISENVFLIEPYVFSGCRNLKRVTIPKGVKEIYPGAFDGCTNLEELTIEGNPIICVDREDWTIPSFENNIKSIIASEEWIQSYKSYFKCLVPPITAQQVERVDTDNKRQGCYVATFVYGSYDCPQVWTLRRYRDFVLAESWYGRAFIRIYYAISPTLVKWFGETEWFRNLWKPRLDRMVESLIRNGMENTPYQDKHW